MVKALRRTWAEIDLGNLSHNFEIIRKHVGPGVKLMGVVKADAYGHGAVRVAQHLERLGASYLAVSNIDEAVELRENGVTLPILMLGLTPADQSERIIGIDMTQTVQDYELAQAYSDEAVRLGKKMKIHIKLDTGMGRLGFQCDDAHFEKSLREMCEVLRLPGLDVEGVFTHFSVSDEDVPDHIEFSKEQHERFVRMIEALEQRAGFKFKLHHCCNAGGIANYPEWSWDMVRCGVILYGAGDLAAKMGMRPVMTLKTTVSAIKEYAPQTSISYGRTFYTRRQSRIAVLPIGYADGLFRALSNKMHVFTPGGYAPQVGRICMDMCMIDVTDIKDLSVGDEVEVFGEHIPCEVDARLCDTICYELLCTVGKRVPRFYV